MWQQKEPYQYVVGLLGTTATFNHDLPPVDPGYQIAIQHIGLYSDDATAKAITAWQKVGDRFWFLGSCASNSIMGSVEPRLPLYLQEGQQLRFAMPAYAATITVSIIVQGWRRRVADPDDGQD